MALVVSEDGARQNLFLRWWASLIGGLMAVEALVALLLGSRDRAVRIGATLLSLFIAAALIRAAKERILIEPTGVRFRGVLKTRRVPWDQFVRFVNRRWLIYSNTCQLERIDGGFDPIGVIVRPGAGTYLQRSRDAINFLNQLASRTRAGWELGEEGWAAARDALRGALVDLALRRDQHAGADISEVADRLRLDPHSTAFYELLLDLSRSDQERGRPLLAALLFQEGTPTQQFWTIARRLEVPSAHLDTFWPVERQRAYEYWESHSAAQASDD
jgi:hypothetical protein